MILRNYYNDLASKYMVILKLECPEAEVSIKQIESQKSEPELSDT